MPAEWERHDATWISWFVLVALILLLTPTGTYPSPRWRLLGRGVIGAGAVAMQRCHNQHS